MEIGLSLGSNLGDRSGNLRQAKSRIALIPATRIIAQSRVYETEPVGVPAAFGDKKFLNAVLIIESKIGLRELACELHTVERQMGRLKGVERNEPRTIDIDIIYAGSERIQDSNLIVPHPRWAERRFVVRPLADVRPDLVLPGQTRAVRQVLSSLPRTPTVVLFSKSW